MDPPLARAEAAMNNAAIPAAMIAPVERHPTRSAFIFLLAIICRNSPMPQLDA
jgi:hypothetical protein